MAERTIAEESTGRPTSDIGRTIPESAPSEGEAPISEAVADERVEVDIAPDRPDRLDEGPGVESGHGTGHQGDLLPGNEDEEQGDADPDTGPSGGPDSSGPTDELFETLETGGPDEQDVTEDPFGLDSGFDVNGDIGGPGEHERGVIEELSEDSLDSAFQDPNSTLEGVPDDQNLSGNETGDGDKGEDDGPPLLDLLGFLTKPMGGGDGGPGGPTFGQPIPGTKYVEGSGWVALEEGEDPDSTTVLEERLEYEAEQEAAEAEADDGTVDGADPGLGDWIASWFAEEEVPSTDPAPTEDRNPDSVPAPKSPTHDDDIGTEYFGIGAEADKGAEIQFTDMPEDDDGEAADYDGIDYGENHVEPDFDIAEAEEMIFIDPMDQPDVDPSDHDSDGPADESADMVE